MTEPEAGPDRSPEPGIGKSATGPRDPRFEQGARIATIGGWDLFDARETGPSGGASGDIGSAVQLWRPSMAEPPAAEAISSRLERAGRVMRLRHAGLAEILEIGTSKTPYIAEAVPLGPTLADLLQAQFWLQPRDALAVTAQLARTLDFAHARHLIHGAPSVHDVVIEETTGRVRLMGLSVPPEERPISAARAPEDLAEGRLSARADLFGLGTLLFELLSGRPAFPGRSPEAIVERIVQGAPDSLARLRPALPAPLLAIVARLLASDPLDRYATGNALAEAIERVMPDIDELHDEPPAGSWAGRRRIPKALLALAAAGALAALIALALLAFWGWPERPDAPEESAIPPRQPPATGVAGTAPTQSAKPPPPATPLPVEPPAPAELPAAPEGEHPAAQPTPLPMAEPIRPTPDTPDGGLERRAAWLAAADELNLLPCSRIETEPGMFRRHVVGIVPGNPEREVATARLREMQDIRDVDLRAAALPPDFCAVLGLLGRTTGVADRRLIELIPARPDPVLYEGDVLALRFHTADAPTFITIDHLMPGGRVAHLRSAPEIEEPVAAHRTLRIGHPLDGPWREVSGPFGEELLMLIAWPAMPAEIADRPETEPLDDYRAALETALAQALDENAPKRPVIASVLSLRTEPLPAP